MRAPSKVDRRFMVFAAAPGLLALAMLLWVAFADRDPESGPTDAPPAERSSASPSMGEPTPRVELDGLALDEGDEGPLREDVPATPGTQPAEPTLTGERFPFATLTLVDLNGHPLYRQNIQAVLSGARVVPKGAKPGRGSLLLAAGELEGIWRLELRTDPAPDATRVLELVHSPRAQRDGTPSLPWRARVELPGALDLERDNELGALVLVPERARLLAEGIVVDEADAPIEGATVHIGEHSYVFGGRASFATEVPTDGQGRFSIQGPSDTVYLGCWATKEGFLRTEFALAAPGASGTLVRMLREAQIRGRLLLDETLAGFVTQFVVVPAGGSGTRRVVSTRWDGSSFALTQLEAGIYDVELYPAGGGLALLVIEGVRADHDATGIDSRLDPLDVRGEIEPLRIRVKNTAGASLGDHSVTIAFQDGASVVLLSSSEGRIATFVPAARGPWTITPQGFRAQTVIPSREELLLDFEAE